LLVEDDPAGNKKAGERQWPGILASRLAQLDCSKPIACKRAEEAQRVDDLATVDRVEEGGAAPADPDPRPSAVVVTLEFDTQVADQTSLAESGERFIASGQVRRRCSPGSED
jgi:hypothetical protein